MSESTKSVNTSVRFSDDPLSHDGPVSDIKQSTHDFLRSHRSTTFWLITFPIGISILAACVEIIGTAITIYYGKPGQWNTNYLQYGTILILLPLMFSGLNYLRVRSRMASLFYTNLASSLGFSYSLSGDISNASAKLFTFGQEGSAQNVLSGLYKNMPLRLYDYQYVTRMGKSQKVHSYIVTELKVDGMLPEVLVKSSVIPSFFIDWQPKGTKKLPLEGDFNRKFTVYAAQGSEIETLQILQPNVMAGLMEDFPEFSFECNGDTVYVFKEGSLAENSDGIRLLLSLIDRLYDKLIPELSGVMRNS